MIETNNVNPFETIQQIAGGYCLPRCLHVVTELGVADALNDTPQTAHELAGKVSCNSDALARVLRLLCAYGVFTVEGQHFGHSPASKLLCSDHPQSMRSFALMFGLDFNWSLYETLSEAVKTGQPAVEQKYPGGFWKYFAEHEEENSIFNAAMAAKAQGQIPGLVASYDFSKFSVIGDIGGGRGHLLQAVLRAVPQAKGVLFDLPHVIKEASGIASERLSLHAGDFFKDYLPQCDIYLVMEIIHDWPDEEAVNILKSIRQASPPHATLLLIETIVPEHAGPDWSKMLD
ncbi:MAG TPA: methyltransferase, partial [Niastella sp.]|nr:methyltransferase [Niastella sp.]